MAQVAVNGTKKDSLLFTNIITSDPFESDAQTELERKTKEERRALLEEISRRSAEGSYNV